ncbi:hypothetical protein D8B26_001874 [Coccidioides posadasii str. Silveira]|uniref:BYS1 domain-containing protein n=4 Tax=Coccidioides posadasii TaxID=199306 RepID=E9CWQ2_COCPS|nr:conserved hypothetical protein [Coccidioides posadasii C735 delta SOWgp]EER23737.1 conserved hypothetical protein [Coccidioides posadasii C735 delta SOWgp]EFW21728.1 BYS1 domain-containing protein [Coccidioides posadasii str. Silveira]KMM65197.1 hypothetical protein CPAG_01549 [Coccidioides posadasii RMSCC 3488]QVM07170.1 hypothetical protein D8B26_001874 [Coccidioides posadasii str. Silveira]|eukprot:XP_003065882.1 conserved hypothetical protein [Coccidioides posadasii C735 delta SOWgp]
MHLKTLLLAAFAATTALAGSAGNAIVENHCPFTVFLWSVGGSIGPKHVLKQGGVYSEKIHRDPQSGGIAIKITRVDDGIFNNSPQTNFAYSLTDTRVFYDLSDVFGDPFSGSKVLLDPSDPNCADICWPNGIPPSGSQVRDCNAGTDLKLTLCA